TKDLIRAERMLLSKCFGQPPPRNRGPTQIDLLGANSSYKGSEQVGLQDRTQTRVACFEAGDDWIRSREFGEWVRRRHEHRSYCLFCNAGMGYMANSDFHGRRVYAPNHGTNERDNLVPHPRSAYQRVAVPAIYAVITRATEDLERGWHVKG